MTLEQLQTFMEVCHCKSIKKASDNLYVSHQAVSRSIQKLEKEFGVALFIRSSNGMELTGAGQTLYNYSKNILSDISSLKQAMSKYQPQGKTKKICNIALSPILMPLYGQKLFYYLSAKYPDVYFNLSAPLYDINNFEYEKYDITLHTFCDIGKLSNSLKIHSPYCYKQLFYFNLYFWISASSNWANYHYLNFDLLRNERFCLLKNTFEQSMIHSGVIKFSKKNPVSLLLVVDLKENFIKNIEEFNYYTIDICTNSVDNLMYTDLFKEHNIVLKPSPHRFILAIIYDKTRYQDLCNSLSLFFNHLPT